MKPILIVGHPGHELRISGWVKKYQPEIVMLTQGDGAAGQPRLQDSEELLKKMDVKIRTDWLEPIPDSEIYQALLGYQASPLPKWLQQLYNQLKNEEDVLIVADQAEGYNPTHEVCRILANKLAASLETAGVKVTNLEFPLMGHPCPSDRKSDVQMMLSLSETELKDKIETGLDYARKSSPRLVEEINEALNLFGEAVFATECLYSGQATIYEAGCLPDKKPHFETVGEERLANGVYKEVIRAKNLHSMVAELNTNKL